MSYYLKIKESKIVQAPKIYTVMHDNKEYICYGYNADSNLQQLTKDGYAAYNLPAAMYEIVSGVITPKEIKPIEKTVFTKLQIRRAMRQLGIENKLDLLLSSSEQIKADWNDAQNINLNDEMFQAALSYGILTEQDIENIKELIQ